MWRCGQVPQAFKDSNKRKCNRQVCDSHRGIPLLNIADRPHRSSSAQCTNRSMTSIVASTIAPASASTLTPTLSTVTSNLRVALPSAPTTSTSFASTAAATSNTTSSATTANDQNAPEVPSTTYTSTISTPSNVDSVATCHRTFASNLSLVGHVQIHPAETGEPVSGVQTYARRTHFNCVIYPCTLSHHMGLLKVTCPFTKTHGKSP
ncbi:hypothetical protein SprV_0301085600 [Sparganum proliferum]